MDRSLNGLRAEMEKLAKLVSALGVQVCTMRIQAVYAVRWAYRLSTPRVLSRLAFHCFGLHLWVRMDLVVLDHVGSSEFLGLDY